MILLFLDIDNDIEEVANMVFKRSLGIENIERGDSVSVYNEIYFKVSFLGILLRLEPNDFDGYEGYNYVIFIREDFLTRLPVGKNEIKSIANIIIRLLARQNIRVGYENKNNELQEYNMSNIRSNAF